MTWTTGIILGLSLLNLLLLLGAIGLLKAKLDAVLNLARILMAPKSMTAPTTAPHPADPPKEDKSVIHLTQEHDSKVLGDEDA